MIRRGLAVGMFVMALPGTAEAAVWGGFDGTRVNYAGGVLATGVDHDEMRLLIGAAGHTIAPPTPTLTAPYLAGVDVFYTSLLNTGAPVLSGAEQAALASWISSGGTLVVTGDIFPLPFYESFTSPFGITAWIDTAAGLASPSAVHPITAGVTTIDPVTQSTFQFGADALEIATADDGNPFAIVLESSTGFCDGGRVLVLGDHNLFNDNGIGLFDNAVLAANVVAWAGVGGGGCGTCGNGLVEPGESCDDADFDDTDDCPSNCQTASCGDGFLWAGFEICDDGNADDTDACPGSCEPANCGDGYVWAGMETCDDANLDDTDACLSSCDLATCGDGFVWVGMEICDDGNPDDMDACLTTCEAATCGDGFVWTGMEDCDDANADDTDDCPGSCLAATCGDGFVWDGVEICDDGNVDDADTCPSTCAWAECGDGFVWTGVEACDDANDDETDACLGDCTLASCGDGVVQAGVEDCDDGNEFDGDDCRSDCTVPVAGSTGGTDTGDAGSTSRGGTDGDDSGGVDETGGPTSGVGGSTGDGPTGGSDDGDASSTDDGGCSCRAQPTGRWGGVLVLIGLLGLRRRSRREDRFRDRGTKRGATG